MKRISFLTILILITGLMISCSQASDDDTEKGYIDPEVEDSKGIEKKAYKIAGETCSDILTGDKACGAIIFKGEIGDTDYVGIATDNQHLVYPPTFKFKIYWKADSIPTGSGLTLPSCKIIINNESISNKDVSGVQIDKNGDGTYTITFTNGVTVGSESINASDNIRAYKYPD